MVKHFSKLFIFTQKLTFDRSFYGSMVFFSQKCEVFKKCGVRIDQKVVRFSQIKGHKNPFETLKLNPLQHSWFLFCCLRVTSYSMV